MPIAPHICPNERHKFVPRASIITVLKVTVLLRPFIMHSMLPCCMPEFCSNRYKDILRCFSKPSVRFATA